MGKKKDACMQLCVLVGMAMHQLENDYGITHLMLTTSFLLSHHGTETEEQKATQEWMNVAEWMHNQKSLRQNEDWCGTLGFTDALTRGMLRHPDADFVYPFNDKASLTEMDASVLLF